MSIVAVLIVGLFVLCAALMSAGRATPALVVFLIAIALVVHESQAPVVDAIGDAVHRATQLAASVANGAVSGGREGLHQGGGRP